MLLGYGRTPTQSLHAALKKAQNTLLLLTLGLIATETVDRVLAAMIGATLMLGLLALLDLAPTFDKLITFIDTSAVVLLFGTMLLVGLLGTTGFFEVATIWVLE
jgi:Na+/H+ antiporter NhaD/arsenite permease-like protein